MDGLGRVGLEVASSLELDGVLAAITRGLVTDLGAAMARVWLLQRNGEEAWLQLAASAGLSERLDGTRSRVPLGELKIGEIASTRVAVCTKALASDPRFVDQAWIREHGLTTFAGYPLLFGDELVGVLAMFSRDALSDEAFEQLGAFAARASVAIKNAGVFGEVKARSRQLEAENSYLREALQPAGGIVGQSAALAQALSQLDRVAPTRTTVLLTGETGTGKELFARAVHERSPRRARAFVKVSCAAIAPTLIESELFGHEKGAFTGAAARRIGRFELADGGTLLLDEVGELPLEAQTKLLRVLQEQELERVGGHQPVRVDVRVVAATNRDLAAEMRADRFRSDLFYRLNVFPIVVPPLRDRREDIPLLAHAYLKTLAGRHAGTSKELDDDALAYLTAYDWPGNVRELQNVLERASILAAGPRIETSDLPELVNAAERQPPPADDGSTLSLKQRVDEVERSLIADALRRADGNQSEAARLLRTSRATLQYKMKLHRLG